MILGVPTHLGLEHTEEDTETGAGYFRVAGVCVPQIGIASL